MNGSTCICFLLEQLWPRKPEAMAGDTQLDLKDVSRYRLSSLRPSNPERPINPLLISPAS